MIGARPWPLRRHLGATVLELCFYVIVFVILMGMILGLFFWLRKSDEGMKRLDIFHDLRMCSFHIADQLSFATSILFPPNDGQAHHQLVFRSKTNELIAVFLNPQGQLVLLNYERFKAGKEGGSVLLARHAIEFTARRRDDRYVAYKVRMLDQRQFEFVLANSVRIRNGLE